MSNTIPGKKEICDVLAPEQVSAARMTVGTTGHEMITFPKHNSQNSEFTARAKKKIYRHLETSMAVDDNVVVTIGPFH